MADKGRSEKSVDNIQEQIRKLLEEKEELERRNREKQQQEQRVIKENVPSRTGSATVSPGDRRSFGSNRDYNDHQFDPNASLTGSQYHRRSMQQNITNLSLEGTASTFDDSIESQRSADDADDDDVMLPEHKQALRQNRDILVENMTPDDIFNDLISKHILSSADVSRIKDRNTTEAINEELLNVLMRRSERAFHVFVASLRRTLQGWLANRLDPGSPQKSKRKRRTGEVNVNLNCDRLVPVRGRKHACSCQEVEEQILIMAKAAFSHIRRRDNTSTAFEQFKKELKQTNEALRESLEVVNTLKLLCRHGEITDMTEGSVCFTICCSSLTSCQELWKAYESGVLLQVFQKGFVTSALLSVCRAKEIFLRLNVSRLEYLDCALELAYKERDSLQPSKSIKRRLKNKYKAQNENIPGKISKVFRHNRGQAFQDIPVNIMPSSTLCHEQNFVDRCDKYTSLSEIQHSMSPTKKHAASDKHLLDQHLLCHQTFAPEQPSGRNIWLRSFGKEPIDYYKHVFTQDITQNSTSDNLQMVGQVTSVSKKGYTRNIQDVCPYNLRYRLINN